MSKKSRRARKLEQDTSTPDSSDTLSQLNRIYLRQDSRTGVNRVHDPFNPRENNVFYRQTPPSQSSIPTSAQIQRFIRDQS